MTHLQRGDWVTIGSEPPFHRGSLGVIVEVKVSRMTVAYCVDDRLEVRHVRIDSVEPGHTPQGRGVAAIAEVLDETKLSGAREAANVAVDRGILSNEAAQQMIDAYAAKIYGPKEKLTAQLVAANQARLTRWLSEHKASGG